MATRTIPIKPVTSWSFSRYNDYRTCPLKFKLKYLLKIQEPPNSAMERGSEIDALAEKYIKGTLARLPSQLALFRDEFKMLRKLYTKKGRVTVQETWAFTRKWTRTQWDDWVHCWLRVKLDCAHLVENDTMIVTDWKTGKWRKEKVEEYMEQLELYALSALLLHPQLREVRVRLGFLDAGFFYPLPKDPPAVYTRDDIPRLMKEWESRVAPMFKDKAYRARPNSGCIWCWYGQHKKESDGGPGLCKF